MKRIHLLAAEIFGYSFANYRDHLGIGHVRYESMMPNDAKTLERAVSEGWDLERVALELHADEETAAQLIDATRNALLVIDAANPAEAFRNAIRQSIRTAVAEGLDDDKAVEQLVVQICYRASDLSVLLEREGHQLERYSETLRHEPDVDDLDR